MFTHETMQLAIVKTKKRTFSCCRNDSITFRTVAIVIVIIIIIIIIG